MIEVLALLFGFIYFCIALFFLIFLFYDDYESVWIIMTKALFWIISIPIIIIKERYFDK